MSSRLPSTQEQTTINSNCQVSFDFSDVNEYRDEVLTALAVNIIQSEACSHTLKHLKPEGVSSKDNE